MYVRNCSKHQLVNRKYYQRDLRIPIVGLRENSLQAKIAYMIHMNDLIDTADPEACGTILTLVTNK